MPKPDIGRESRCLPTLPAFHTPVRGDPRPNVVIIIIIIIIITDLYSAFRPENTEALGRSGVEKLEWFGYLR